MRAENQWRGQWYGVFGDLMTLAWKGRKERSRTLIVDGAGRHTEDGTVLEPDRAARLVLKAGPLGSTPYTRGADAPFWNERPAFPR